MNSKTAPNVSIIVACFCEEASVDAVYGGLVAALESQSRRYEIVFVNDGSTDGTLSRLQAIWESDTRVVLVDLVRNSGQWPALTAGIREATGDSIVFMDCDLQLEPNDLPRLLDVYDQGYDLVGGRRANRVDSPLRRAFSRTGNLVLRGITRGKLQDLGCALKVFNAHFIQAFEFGPMTPFRPMQVIASIDNMTEVEVCHYARAHGTSKWGSRVLIQNFGFAMLDLLQGRLRKAGLVAMAASISAVLLYAAATASGFGTALLPVLLVVALLTLQAGVGLVVSDLLILALVARRVRPAYVVRRVYRHTGEGN